MMYGIPIGERLAFGVVLGLVMQRSGGRDICIGISPDSSLQYTRDVVGPTLESEHEFQSGDSLIVMTRRSLFEMEGSIGNDNSNPLGTATTITTMVSSANDVTDPLVGDTVVEDIRDI